MKIFGSNKNKPDDYNGPRTAQGLVDAAITAAKNKANIQLGGKRSESTTKVCLLFVQLIYYILCGIA